MELIRKVQIEGYTLELFDTGHTRGNKCVVGYRFTRSAFGLDRELVIFESMSDFCCSPLHCIDSNETVRGILAFLTLRIGDTDNDYFDGYTEDQKAFRESDAESLAMYSFDPEDGGYPLIDCPDCPHCETNS